MIRFLLCSCLFLQLFCTRQAQSESPISTKIEDRGEAEETGGASLPALAAAIMPGVVVHGMGEMASGEAEAGRTLFYASLAGLAMAASGYALLFSTNANRVASEPAIPLLVSGTGIYGLTWLADLYAAATGGRAERERATPQAAVSLGYGYIRDPQFSYRHFAIAEAFFRRGRYQLQPSLWQSSDGGNHRARLEARARLWQEPHGSRLQVLVAGTDHRFTEERFRTRTYETALDARINLAMLGPRLAGAFSFLQAGMGLQSIDIDAMDTPTTYSRLVLGRVGCGLYLPGEGELALYYDHRRDDYAGGISLSETGQNGRFGHFGASYRQNLGERFALRTVAEVGSAKVLSMALEARWGQRQ